MRWGIHSQPPREKSSRESNLLTYREPETQDHTYRQSKHDNVGSDVWYRDTDIEWCWLNASRRNLSIPKSMNWPTGKDLDKHYRYPPQDYYNTGDTCGEEESSGYEYSPIEE